MNTVKLFLFSIILMGIHVQTYAGNGPGGVVSLTVNVKSLDRNMVTFNHLLDTDQSKQSSETIMLHDGQGIIKRQLPGVLQIVSFNQVPVLVNAGEQVEMSMDLLQQQVPGHAYTARFKGVNALKQSLPYRMDSLYRISADRLSTMNAAGLTSYLSERAVAVRALLAKAKINNPQERLLLARYESMLKTLVEKAFVTAHEAQKDLPADFLAASLKDENFKGGELARICREDLMGTYVWSLLDAKSTSSDSLLKKWELILVDRNQFLIHSYILPHYRAMFRSKGLTAELEDFYSKLKLACTDREAMSKLAELYTFHLNLMPGKPAPDFALYDYNDKLVRLSDFKGKMVVIDCWGTWCSGCLYNLPFFEEVAKGYKDSTEIVFISMALEAKDGLGWRKYIKEHNMEKGIHLHIPRDVNDPTEVFLRKVYQLDTYPRYMAIDRQGNIIDTHVDYPQFPAFKEKIDQWYKEKR